MKTLLASLFILLASTAFAGGTVKVTDLQAALNSARSQGKLLFVQYGRDICEHCQALKGMIVSGEVQLPESKYVYADVNCDDAKTKELFKKMFTTTGTGLPFVVVAAPDGTQLAARTGEGSARAYSNLLRHAQKAAKKLADGGAAQKKLTHRAAVFALRLPRQMRFLSLRMNICPSLSAGEAKTFSFKSLSARSL